MDYIEYAHLKPEVASIQQAIKALEQELNALVTAFQNDTGIPIILEASPPKSKYIGAKPVPEITVGAYIYDPH